MRAHPGELALLVVDVSRAVDARADLDLVLEEVVHDLLGHEREVRDHGELEILADRFVLLQRVLDGVLDALPVHQRLAALELDRHVGVRALKHEIHRLLDDLRAHVRVQRVHVGPRGVAVDAGLVAPQRDDDDVEVGAVVDEPLALAEHLRRAEHVVVIPEEVVRLQPLVKIGPLLRLGAREEAELLFGEQEPAAFLIRDQDLFPDLPKAEEGRMTRVGLSDLREDHRMPRCLIVSPRAKFWSSPTMRCWSFGFFAVIFTTHAASSSESSKSANPSKRLTASSTASPA